MSVSRQSSVNSGAEPAFTVAYDHLAACACTAVFDELVDAAPMLAPSPADDELSQREPLAQLFRHVAEHARLYQALLGEEGSARVINHLLRRIAISAHIARRTSDDDWRTHADDPAEIPPDPEAAFVAGAALGVVIDWLRRGCPGTPEQMAAAVTPYFTAAAATGARGGHATDEG